MLIDIVVDTNVLAHADNPQEQRQQDAIDLLTRLLNSETRLAIDEGFDFDEALNKSAIWQEYRANLSPTAPAFHFINALASQGRISEKSLKLDVAVVKKINQLIKKQTDRKFLRIAVNSVEHLLTSHDYVDFQEAKRASIKKTIQVTVCDAAAAAALV
jgi:hypothetical protein